MPHQQIPRTSKIDGVEDQTKDLAEQLNYKGRAEPAASTHMFNNFSPTLLHRPLGGSDSAQEANYGM